MAIVAGADNGNGTIWFAGNQVTPHGMVEHRAGFLSGYNRSDAGMISLMSGDEKLNRQGGRQKYFSDSEIKSRLNQLNGGVDDFYVDYDGQPYWLGLSAHMRNETPIKLNTADRYANPKYMKLMVLGGISALIYSGLDVQKQNDLYLAFGVPTQWFYDKTSQYRDLEQFCRNVIKGYTFGITGQYKFTVSGTIIVPEGIGAYYDYMFDSCLNEINDDGAGTLVIDAGHGTLDTMIVQNYEVARRDEIYSRDKTRTKSIFSNVSRFINRQGFDAAEAEALFLTGVASRYGGITYDDILPFMVSQTEIFLERIATEVPGLYAGKEGMYDNVLLVGGIIGICEVLGIKPLDFIGFRSKDVHDLPVSANAGGFEKVLRYKLTMAGLA